MIEARTNGVDTSQQADTPKTITVSMIIEDLNAGTDRTGIQEKYGLEKWEVSQMFQHPSLKGRKAKKVRKLSFDFVDDTAADPSQTSIAMEETTIEEHTATEIVDSFADTSDDEQLEF